MSRGERIAFFFIVCLPIVYLFADLAVAENDNNGGKKDGTFAQGALDRYTAKEIRQDLLTPTSPAFGVLGVTPEEVIRPDTPKALGAALLNGVDSEGNLQTGVAIDFSPFYLFSGRHGTLSEYRKNLQTRLANRTQFSLATTKGSDENDKSMRVALGVRVALIDKADPRMAPFLDSCYLKDSNGQLQLSEEIQKEKRLREDLETNLTTTRALSNHLEQILSQMDFSLRLIRKNIDEAIKNDRTGSPSLTADEWKKLLKDFPEKNPRIDSIKRKNPSPPPEDLPLGKVFFEKLSLVELNELLPLAQTKVQVKKVAIEKELVLAQDDDAKAEKQLDAQLNKVFTLCNKAWLEQNWNATNVSIGFAPIFFSEKGDVSDLEGSGIAIYGTVSYGFDGISSLEDSSQVILHARYRTNEQVANPNVAGSFIEQDLFVLGGQLRIAGPDFGNKIGGKDLAFFGELDYRFADPDGQSNDTSNRYAFGMDLKVAEDVTLSLTVGDESGDDVGRSSSFALGNLKWGF